MSVNFFVNPQKLTAFPDFTRLIFKYLRVQKFKNFNFEKLNLQSSCPQGYLKFTCRAQPLNKLLKKEGQLFGRALALNQTKITAKLDLFDSHKFE